PVTALGFLLGLLQWRGFSGGGPRRASTGGGAGREPPGPPRPLGAPAWGKRAGPFFPAPPRPPGRPGAAHPPPPRAASPTPAAPPPPPATAHDAPWPSVAAPCAPLRACVQEATAESGLRVALVCEEGFRDRPEFLDAVCACVVSGLERQRLDAALATSLAEVAASRKRLVGAADSAPQKIERDLHDGAQQQLVALRGQLEPA